MVWHLPGSSHSGIPLSIFREPHVILRRERVEEFMNRSARLLNVVYRNVSHRMGETNTQDRLPLRPSLAQPTPFCLSQVWDEERIRAEAVRRSQDARELSEKAIPQKVRYSMD